jgi:hypothetical protein
MNSVRRDQNGRTQFKTALLLLLSAGPLAGCQSAWRIGARNSCTVAVEATVSEVGEKSPPFHLLEPGATVELREVPEGKPSVLVGVRSPGSTAVPLVKVRTSDLAKAPKGAKSDLIYEITDCPT